MYYVIRDCKDVFNIYLLQAAAKQVSDGTGRGEVHGADYAGGHGGVRGGQRAVHPESWLLARLHSAAENYLHQKAFRLHQQAVIIFILYKFIILELFFGQISSSMKGQTSSLYVFMYSLRQFTTLNFSFSLIRSIKLQVSLPFGLDDRGVAVPVRAPAGPVHA